MINTITMYIIQNEEDLPKQLLPNSAYYVLNKYVIVVDNTGTGTNFSPHEEAKTGLETRLENCQRDIARVIKHLTSFN